MKTTKEYYIWSDEVSQDFVDEEMAYQAEYEDNDMTETEAWEYCQELVWEYLNDEKMNLNKELGHTIIALCDLGLWFGRRQGIRVLGSNLNSIFDVLGSDYSNVKFYSDGKNIRARLPHHDGTHYIVFRLCTKGQAEEVGRKWMDGEIDESNMFRYTRSLHQDVANVYGW